MTKKMVIPFVIGIILISALAINYFVVTSNDLIILKAGEIEKAQLCVGIKSSAETKDTKQINELVECLRNIPMKKADPTEEVKLMNDTVIQGSVTFEAGGKTVGAAFLFESGEILMPDVNTLNGKKRTQSYIGKLSKEKQEKIIKIINMANKNKEI